MTALTSAFIYVAAAVAEIAGSFAFWVWLRQDKSALFDRLGPFPDTFEGNGIGKPIAIE